MFSVTERRILQLDTGQASVWRWRRGALEKEADFAPDVAGAAAFAAHLASRPGSHYALMADVAEEGYQAETLPFVRGSRQALIRRKLDQAFYGSPLTLAHSLGREQAGRRDEHVLLLGLRQPAFFEPWLATLRRSGTTLSGLYSTALLAAELVRRQLHGDAPRFLLLTLGRAGIRLSFFENGWLRFSHLGQLAPGSPREIAAACAQEAGRLMQYLLGQRLAIRNASLPCLILAHPDHLGAFAEECGDTTELEFRLEDITAVARKAGLIEAPADSLADRLLLHLAMAHPPREQFAPPPERHLHRLWRQRRFATWGAAAFLGLSLFLSAGEMWLAAQAFERADVMTREGDALNRQYRARIAALPPLPTLPENLKSLNLAYRELERHSARPGDSFLQIGQALEAYPEIRLEKLEWELGGNDTGAPASPRDGKEGLHVIATLHASLPSGTGLRQQLDIVDAFTATLARDPALSVTLLKSPLNIEPGKFLRGGGGEEGAHEFSLRLSRRL